MSQVGPTAPGARPANWWRTLEERAELPAFQERLYNEFPSEVEAVTDPVARRTFLKLMGASIGLAGITACTRQPEEPIVPYVKQPEEIVPGKPLFFATAMSLGGVATGLLVESTRVGRQKSKATQTIRAASAPPTSSRRPRSSICTIPTGPARSRNVGDIRPWSTFLATVRAALSAQQPLHGAGLRLLTEAVNSPTLAAQIQDLLQRFSCREVAPVGSGQPPECLRRHKARVRPVRRHSASRRSG
jgi:molybdopterin-containing oxidoreductase family iron-sulfur binding subunit